MAPFNFPFPNAFFTIFISLTFILTESIYAENPITLGSQELLYINLKRRERRFEQKLQIFFKLVRWDFGYCGHYCPIVPAPDDR
jgi:hypothetical protein